ncbi:MAG: transglycosylase SLT domain-containing protein [Candidatus Dormibacteria bacterium]
MSASSPSSITPVSPAQSEMRRLAEATRVLEAPSSGTLASRLVSAYATLRDAKRPTAARAGAARAIQLGTAQLLAQPDWRAPALASLRGADRTSAQAILDAGDELAVLGDEVDGTPKWQIFAPEPAETLLAHYHEGERSYGIPWPYLAAINLVETAMGRIHGLSVAGAQGPMQFMPATWATFGRGDVNDPHDSILAAARYLHASGGPGDMDAAIYAYNRSHHYVRAVDVFASQVATDPDAFLLYYNWDVVVPTGAGPALIPQGWVAPQQP